MGQLVQTENMKKEVYLPGEGLLRVGTTIYVNITSRGLLGLEDSGFIAYKVSPLSGSPQYENVIWNGDPHRSVSIECVEFNRLKHSDRSILFLIINSAGEVVGCKADTLPGVIQVSLRHEDTVREILKLRKEKRIPSQWKLRLFSLRRYIRSLFPINPEDTTVWNRDWDSPFRLPNRSGILLYQFRKFLERIITTIKSYRRF